MFRFIVVGIVSIALSGCQYIAPEVATLCTNDGAKVESLIGGSQAGADLTAACADVNVTVPNVAPPATAPAATPSS